MFRIGRDILTLENTVIGTAQLLARNLGKQKQTTVFSCHRCAGTSTTSKRFAGSQSNPGAGRGEEREGAREEARDALTRSLLGQTSNSSKPASFVYAADPDREVWSGEEKQSDLTRASCLGDAAQAAINRVIASGSRWRVNSRKRDAVAAIVRRVSPDSAILTTSKKRSFSSE